jgi:hypothetical protein
METRNDKGYENGDGFVSTEVPRKVKKSLIDAIHKWIKAYRKSEARPAA